ncbi:methionine synthase reductase-like isoform X2 [Halichondria panicea]|uniref:methionine synthase reductase-like isoform X2 n=1 Tax=Halichondria panicea TaxID=6063 RepID=UPI00312B7C9F
MATTKDEEKKFLLVFGSETGQAKAIAEIIRDKALERGLLPDTLCFSQYNKGFKLPTERALVVVVSTTGDGDPPETVRKAWRRLKGKSLSSDHLKHLHFALLGLGDTNYDNFCNMGKMLSQRLLELGATAFHPPGFADDAVGLEDVVEPWIEGLWSPLVRLLSGEEDSNHDSNAISMTTEPSEEAVDTIVEKETTLLTSSPTRSSHGNTQTTDVLVKDVIASLSDDLQRCTLNPVTPLSLPTPPPSYLTVTLGETTDNTFPFNKIPYRLGSRVSMATITSSKQLTNEGAVKKTLEMSFRIIADDMHYEPGDAVGFVCPSPFSEVQWLLRRLDLTSHAQQQIMISIRENTTKKKATPPSHVPTPCTVEQLFSHCLNIRAVPKKAFLCLLAKHCRDGGEQRRLEELASRQCGAQYTRLFTELRTDLLDLLNSFPSCRPPLDILIENLPRLQPRYYSVTSSPLTDPHSLTVAFNVEHLPPRSWGVANRCGLATGWLELAANQITVSPVQIPVFPRSQNPFRLPRNPMTPIIMIGPGTGVAPFIGFLRHMAQQRVGGATQRRAWLFFGCRHPHLDYLYQKELVQFQSSGVLTKLTVTFSRPVGEVGVASEVGGTGYVQDRVRVEWREVGEWIVEHQATVYMCGDAVTMLRDTQLALQEVIARYLASGSSVSAESADKVVARIREEGRLLVDLWT